MKNLDPTVIWMQHATRNSKAFSFRFSLHWRVWTILLLKSLYPVQYRAMIYWALRFNCRGDCRDPDNLNRLAISLVERHSPCQRGHEFKSPAGKVTKKRKTLGSGLLHNKVKVQCNNFKMINPAAPGRPVLEF